MASSPKPAGLAAAEGLGVTGRSRSVVCFDTDYNTDFSAADFADLDEHADADTADGNAGALVAVVADVVVVVVVGVDAEFAVAEQSHSSLMSSKKMDSMNWVDRKVSTIAAVGK